jgi:hypothetical protein
MPTPSKSVLGWSRFISWTGHDLRTNNITMLLLNCPGSTKREFISAFAPDARPLLQNPHLANAFLLESLVLHTRDFFLSISTPLYSHEFQIGHSDNAEAYLDCSRAFLTLVRQITQVITDFPILSGAITHLQTQHKWWFANFYSPEQLKWEFPQATWDFFHGEITLLNTYSNHCRERAKIGINECLAMANNRGTEQMSKLLLAQEILRS